MSNLISIILPVYNNERHLSRCIKSILNQSHNEIELIIVDDGSTDNSGNICDEFALNDDRVVCIHINFPHCNCSLTKKDISSIFTQYAYDSVV